MAKTQYEQLGVSSKKEEVHAATASLYKGLFPGAFCQIHPDIFTGSPDHGLISHADGTSP